MLGQDNKIGNRYSIPGKDIGIAYQDRIPGQDIGKDTKTGY